MRVFGANDKGRWIAILDDRHFSDAGTGFHRGEHWCAGCPDMNIEAAGEHYEDVLVLCSRR
jgi:hypothetical protein